MVSNNEKVTRLLIVRHCQTSGNEKLIFQGRTDTSITNTGIYQLGLISARLSNEKIDVIYTSPLPRTIKTARAINAFHDVPVVEDEGLIEIFVGDIDGVNVFEIYEKFPEVAIQWNDTHWLFAPPNGETMRDVYNRVSKAITKIIKDNEGKTIVITSHGCAIRCLMCFLCGYPVEEIEKIPLGTNTSLSIVEVVDGKNQVKLVSDYAHLPKCMKSPHEFKLPVGKL